jgi:L-cysteine:1D-myo-inositol 2-amino-2-deoxy-alpha-D-glucopyranoside ligase
MSASEAQVADPGQPFARAYVHAGMVGYDGAKMSKSRGNLVFVSRLRRSGVDPVAIRLALLAHHYRSEWEWTDDVLREAEERLSRWSGSLGRVSLSRAERLVDDVRAALADDLDAPSALRCVDACADEPAADGSGAVLVQELVDARLGVALDLSGAQA